MVELPVDHFGVRLVRGIRASEDVTCPLRGQLGKTSVVATRTTSGASVYSGRSASRRVSNRS